MLRGATTQEWQYAMLVVIGGVTLLFAWIGLRRNMSRV
jgi:HAMP domain-containing protein